MRVTVIDYKAGNLTSVLKALRHLGAEPVVTDPDLSLIESAERIVLPGRRAFCGDGAPGCDRHDQGDSCCNCARCSFPWDLRGHAVAVRRIDGSGRATGAWPFRGIVYAVSRMQQKVPHVGWNSLEPKPGSRLLAGVEPRRVSSTSRIPIKLLLQRTPLLLHIHRAVCSGGGARQCDGRAVPSGKIRRDRVEDSAQFSGVQTC